MHCPYCQAPDTRVIDSRELGSGESIRRRRECQVCNRRFTTYERVEEVLPLVVKKDGRREDFSREKILAGVRKACEKRPLDAAAVEGLVDDVVEAVMSLGQSEVASAGIGELVMRGLQDLDPIAYVRFACVYRAFTDLDTLRETLDELHAAQSSVHPREQLTLLPEDELQRLLAPPRILPLPRGAERQARGRRRAQA